jgi:hypothetical protein
MFIAFEGPDEVGKSTSAQALAYDGVPIYNITKKEHEAIPRDAAHSHDLVITYDRIDWLTHMVYRLALPDRDWGDDRPRTVFAMPDTHLVLKMHHPERAKEIEAFGEGYAPGRIQDVNFMYFHQIDFLSKLNQAKDYALFRSVSIVEVWHDQKQGIFEQRLVSFNSAAFSHYQSVGMGLVDSDERLLEFLQYVESQTL